MAGRSRSWRRRASLIAETGSPATIVPVGLTVVGSKYQASVAGSAGDPSSSRSDTKTKGSCPGCATVGVARALKAKAAARRISQRIIALCLPRMQREPNPAGSIGKAPRRRTMSAKKSAARKAAFLKGSGQPGTRPSPPNARKSPARGRACTAGRTRRSGAAAPVDAARRGPVPRYAGGDLRRQGGLRRSRDERRNPPTSTTRWLGFARRQDEAIERGQALSEADKARDREEYARRRHAP